MNKIFNLLIGPNSCCKLDEASTNLSTNESSGFLAPGPFSSPDSKSKPARPKRRSDMKKVEFTEFRVYRIYSSTKQHCAQGKCTATWAD